MPVVEMPNGDLVEFPDDMPNEEIGSFIQSKFPEAFETTVMGQVGETLKAIPRGFGRTLLTAAEGAGELADAVTNKIGLEGLVDSGDDNALVAAARQGQKALNESFLGVDDLYQDQWMTKFGEGLGSMATFVTPTAAFRLAGLAGRANKTTAALAAATGSGEQAQRIQQARDEGIEVDVDQEDNATLVGSVIGLTELLPVQRLLRHLDPDLVPPEAKVTIMQKLSSALASGGVEALQETSASLMQDYTEKGIYNPEMDFGADAIESFTVGGAVGFTADLVLNAMAGRRNRANRETQESDELQKRGEEEERAKVRRSQFERGAVAEEVVEEEIDPATIVPKSDNMANHAKDIAVQMGRNFPTETSFNIEQISIPVDETTSEPAFQVVDSAGQSYGSPLREYEQAAVLAGTLNREIVDQTARNSTEEIIEATPEQYDEATTQSLEVIGNRIKNPRANEITADALNVAADTTMDQGFEENLTAEQAMQRNMGRVFTEQDMVNSLTASQRVNRKRLAQGMPETNTFTVTEAREVLGKDFGRLGDIGAGGIIETQKYSVAKDKKGNPVVVSSLGEVINSKSVQKLRKKDGKPYTQKRKLKTESDARILADRLNSRYDKAVDEVVFEDIKAGNAEIKALLERKNIPNELDSPAIKTMAKAFVGKENVNDMDTGEKKFFYQKIRKLPVVPSPLAEGLPDFDQAPTLTQGVAVDAEPLALPSPESVVDASGRVLPSAELVADMQERLNAELKRKNLSNQGVTGRIFQEFRDYGLNKEDQPVFTSEVMEETEGGYLKDFNEIAVGVRQALQFHEERTGTKVDMNDSDAVFAVIKDVLNHETVHSLRRLDLFTEAEYKVLEKAAENTKRQGEDITYLADAEARYADLKLTRTQIMEEAVAELVRQNTNLGGRPRTIINKIKDILEAIARFISGSPPTVQRIVAGIESGDIGARTAGEVRTLRATRDRLNLYEYESIDDVAPAGSGRGAKIGNTLEELEKQLQPIKEVTVAEIDEQPIARSTRTNTKFIQSFIDKGNLILGESSYFPDGRLQHKNHFQHQKVARGITDEQINEVMNYGNMFKAYPDGKNRPPGVIFRNRETTVVGEVRGNELVLKTVYKTKRSPELNEREEKLQNNHWAGDDAIAYSRRKTIPKKTVKAYKLFSAKSSKPDEYFPLFVYTDKSVPVGEWVEAKAGKLNAQGKVIVGTESEAAKKAKKSDKSKGKEKDEGLAYRPGWHAGDYASATHIGGMSGGRGPSADKRARGVKPQRKFGGEVNYRKADQAWTEIEMADDVNWQSEANQRARIMSSGQPDVQTAHITDQIPKGGFYRYKTNPNMTGNWLIGGDMKVNRVLTPQEVKEIGLETNMPDLPLLPDLIEQENLKWKDLAPTARKELKTFYPDVYNTMAPQSEQVKRPAAPKWFQDSSIAYSRRGESIARNKNGNPLGINVAVDKKFGIDYADLIVNGSKKYESRESTSLNPYIGKRVGIVRTGAGPAEVIGSVEVGEPIQVDETEFNNLRNDHLVPEGSRFDIKSGQTKYLYPMIDPSPSDPQRVTASGIVSRVIPEQEISYSRRQGITIPEASSTAPTLPVGEVEAELQSLLDRTNGNPTSRQLSNITGAPTPRTITNKTGKKVIDKKRDGEVKPTSLAELRAMARRGLQEGQNDLRWYDQFGSGLKDIIGDANIEEASVIFGITSQQNSAEQNLADTLHIMSVARRIDPVENTAAFIKELKEGTRPNGQKVKITGDQINRIVRMYTEGYANAGLKTSTYMQLIQDRSRNLFNPFSVQDVHMARAFGFRRKNYKDGNLVDAAMIPGDLQYRYAQYLTSYLAQEFGVTPNQMQAALWFVAKDTLSPKKGKAAAGTWVSSRRFAEPEAKVIQQQIEDGVFDTTSPLTPALEKGVRPRNAPKVKQDPYTNYLQIDELTELAAQRAPRVLASANPGNARGYGFPETVSLEEIVAFNKGALDVITDQDGQIPFIRQMGIPHVVESSFGTYEGIEPNIQIRLLDGTLEQANFVGNVLGDALLQDAVVTEKPIYDQGSQVGIAATKADGSVFTEEEVMAIANKANPDKDPYGLNFTLVDGGRALAFTDGRTFDRKEFPDYTPEMSEEFADKVLNAFDNDVQYVYSQYTQQGNYYESEGYSGAIRGEGNTESFPGSSDILSTVNDTLYKPFWDYYTAEAERIGFTPQNLTAPSPPIAPESVRPQVVQPRSIPPAEVEAVVEKNLEALENTTGGAVPTFSVKASPEAQAVARNPELGAKPTKENNTVYSRRRPTDPEVRAAVDKVIQPAYEGKGILQNLLSFMSPSTTGEYKSVFSKFRQGFINRYEPLEKMSKMMKDTLGALADTSAYFGMVMADRSSSQTASSIKNGVTEYDAKAGIFRTKDFMYTGKDGITKKVDGMLGVFEKLMPSENVYGENLMEVFQGLAIARRAKDINDSGKLSPVPKGEEAAFLAEMEAMADKYINPETGESYVREAYDMYQAYNNEVIKLMKDSGLITDQEARSWERSSVYYPFYKDFDADPNSETNQETSDGKLVNVDSILNIGMENSPSFLPQEKIGSQKLRRLDGSRLKIDVPPLEAMVKNLDAAINMSMKNIAYQRAMRDAVYLGFASKIEKGRKMKALKKGEISNDIYIRENGKDVHYKVHDQLLFAALTPVADGSLVTNITTYTSIPARFLRESVTRSPGFMGVNMLRDTLSAFVTSGASFTPVLDTAKNFMTDLTEFEKLGIVTGYDNINDPKDLAAFLSKQMRKKGIDTGASKGRRAWENSLGKAWDWLGAGTTKSDFATRKAVYDDVLARTGNQAEAMHQAIEVLNFGRRGGNAAYRMIAAATPFLNARIQGLDVLWRSGLGTYSSRSDLGKAQIQRNALLRASYLTALTAAYWMLVSDDDQYKESSDYIRDNNWLIPNPFGPNPIKIPIPFEIGLLFKTFPEKALDATFKDATARDFTQTVGRGIGATLEANPLGMFQITAPIVEVAVNKNFYTGRQVVPYYIDQGLVAGLQDNVTTTQFAEWLGQSTGMSPLKIDHVLNGYAGSLGMLFLDTTDWVLRTPTITGDFSESMPTMSLGEHPAFRRFFAREEGSGLAEDFYEMNRYVQQAVQTLGKLEDDGRIEEYQKFMYGREHLFELQKDFNKIKNELGEFREYRQAILRSDIHPDIKQEQIRDLDKSQNEFLSIVPELKDLVRLPLFGQIPFIGESTFKEGGP